ncbi:MAG: hypothetical protein JST19_15205 [Bacteroidetes bacterium]|nr:hypothetical protein [Bacteroidota bacterium]
MTNTENKKEPGEDGLHEFTLHIGGRDLTCLVEKQGNNLKVNIDNNTTAELEVHWDGSISQVSGNTLPDSEIEFIKKHVLGHDV